MTRPLIAVVCALLALACATPVRERCRFINEHVPRPPMPAELAQLDRALIHRATEFTLALRRLKRLPTRAYQRDFAETLLPAICERMERARGEAAAGHVHQAGVHYQNLIVASQVLGLEVGLLQVGDYADQAGQPTAQIAETLWRFDTDMMPFWGAAMSEDPSRLVGEMPDLVVRYNAWLKYLDSWMAKLDLGQHRVEIARLLWDTFMVSAAMAEVGTSAAEILSASRLPPGFGALAGGAEGTAALAIDRAAMIDMLEAIRRLIASGALDPAIVAGISHMTGSGGSIDAFDPSGVKSMAMGATGGRTPKEKAAAPPKVDKQIPVSKKEWGEAARHWEEAQRVGRPRFLTIYRPGASANRAAAIGGLEKQPPLDLDEYPPAMFKEGGAGAHVRALDASSNRALGGYIQKMCRGLPDGAVVQILITD